MTVASTINRKEYAGNGVTTSFATSPMVFFAAADLDVIVTTDATGAEETLVLNTDYTVSGGSGSTGTVSLAGGSDPYGAPATGKSIVIVRNLDLVQEYDPENNDSMDAEDLEDAFDKVVMILQQHDARIERSMRLSDGDTSGASTQLPVPEGSHLLGWNPEGTAIINYEAETGTSLVDLAADAGSSYIGFLQSGTGAVKQFLQEKNRQIVNVYDFMSTEQRTAYLSGDTSVDMSDAIQAAIDAVCPIQGAATQAGTVIADPRYPMLVTTTLNLTSSRETGTRNRDYLKFKGFVLIGETGDGYAIVETTGAQWLQLEGELRSGSSNKSTVGLYQGVSSVLTQTQNQKISLIVSMHDDSAANGGLGTIAVWNYGAEENTYDTMYLVANRPVVFTAYNGSPGAYGSYAHSYQTLSSSHSLGVSTFTGECFFVTMNKRAPAICTEGVNSFVIENGYVSNTGSGGSNTAAWEVRSGLEGLRFSGTVEQLATLFDVYGTISGADVRATFGTVADTSTEAIKLRRGGEGIIHESDIRLHFNATASRSLITAAPSAVSELISCYLRNCEFTTNLAVSRLALPENLLANADTCNVKVRGLTGYEFRVGNGWQEIDVPEATVLTGTTAGNIAVVNMPTLNGVANSGGISLVVEGGLRIAGSTTNSMSARYFAASQSVAVKPDGTIYLSDSAGAAGSQGDMLTTTQADVNAGGNSITAADLSAAASGTDTVTLTITPTRAGANAEDVLFRGTVRMYWGGWSGPAPRLERA